MTNAKRLIVVLVVLVGGVLLSGCGESHKAPLYGYPLDRELDEGIQSAVLD